MWIALEPVRDVKRIVQQKDKVKGIGFPTLHKEPKNAHRIGTKFKS